MPLRNMKKHILTMQEERMRLGAKPIKTDWSLNPKLVHKLPAIPLTDGREEGELTAMRVEIRRLREQLNPTPIPPQATVLAQLNSIETRMALMDAARQQLKGGNLPRVRVIPPSHVEGKRNTRKRAQQACRKAVQDFRESIEAVQDVQEYPAYTPCFPTTPKGVDPELVEKWEPLG